MDIDLVNKISGLSIHGYYEPSKDMVMVHFFSNELEKSDIVGYLNRDMSWEVREITGEKATLLPDREVIEVSHSQIGTFEKGSKFDQFVRSALVSMVPEDNEKPLKELNKMFRILEDGYYEDN